MADAMAFGGVRNIVEFPKRLRRFEWPFVVIGVGWGLAVLSMTGARGGTPRMAQFDFGDPNALNDEWPPKPQKPQAPVSKAAQVIPIAERFCSAIGEPMTASVRSMLVTTYPDPDESDRALPRWQVESLAETYVSVLDRTGVVTFYENYELADSPGLSPKISASANAISKFWKVIDASGQSRKDIGTPTVSPAPNSEMPNGGRGLQVKADRLYHGIPFCYQTEEVYVEANTGQVCKLDAQFDVQPPASDVRSISSAQASRLASMVIARAGMGFVNLQQTKLCVVQPNSFVETRGHSMSVPVPGPGKVAWDCFYSAAPANGRGYSYCDIWIDAKDGSCLGGDEFRASGGSRFSKLQ